MSLSCAKPALLLGTIWSTRPALLKVTLDPLLGLRQVQECGDKVSSKQGLVSRRPSSQRSQEPIQSSQMHTPQFPVGPHQLHSSETRV